MKLCHWPHKSLPRNWTNGVSRSTVAKWRMVKIHNNLQTVHMVASFNSKNSKKSSYPSLSETKKRKKKTRLPTQMTKITDFFYNVTGTVEDRMEGSRKTSG